MAAAGPRLSPEFTRSASAKAGQHSRFTARAGRAGDGGAAISARRPEMCQERLGSDSLVPI